MQEGYLSVKDLIHTVETCRRKKGGVCQPPGGTPCNTPLAHLLKCTLFAPSPPTPLPAKKKKMQNLCFSFLLGVTAVQRETGNNAYTKFGGANTVHYGRSASGE